MTDTTYNGWANYETWNVALWINNDEGLYDLALKYRNYAEFAEDIHQLGLTKTPDGVAYRDSGLDIEELDELLVENREEG